MDEEGREDSLPLMFETMGERRSPEVKRRQWVLTSLGLAYILIIVSHPKILLRIQPNSLVDLLCNFHTRQNTP